MTLEEIAVLEAIASGASVGLGAEMVEKLRELGLVYGDQGAATLFPTESGLKLLEACRQSLKGSS